MIILIGLESWKEEIEVPLYDIATIAAATNNFSEAKVIGKGGFGPVYKVMDLICHQTLDRKIYEPLSILLMVDRKHLHYLYDTGNSFNRTGSCGKEAFK